MFRNYWLNANSNFYFFQSLDRPQVVVVMVMMII